MALIPFLKTSKNFLGYYRTTFVNAIVPDGHGSAWITDSLNYVKLVNLSNGSFPSPSM